MAEVAICSLVRDGMDYLPSYRSQLENLRLPEGVTWRLYILEGDSRDGSRDYLKAWAEADPRITVGQEHVGDATEKEDRATRWARVGNACLDLIPATASHTHVLWLEADLCFPPELVARLLAREVDVVAPMIFLGGRFYDSWGFRDLKGRRWKNHAPYHPKYRAFALMEMGSVGSCVLFRRAILDAGIRFKGTYEEGLLVGVCRDARNLGFRIWADTATAILHPMGPWEAQMWRPVQVELRGLDGQLYPLSLQDAAAMGLRQNLPLLDPHALVRTQRHFLKACLRHLQTRGLEVQVTAGSAQGKRYTLQIRALPPSGAFQWTWLQRVCASLIPAGLLRAWPKEGSASTRPGILGRLVPLRTSMHLEETH